MTETKCIFRNISMLSFAQGFTHWHYKLEGQTMAEALAPGFFEGFRKEDDFGKLGMSPGDMITITSEEDGGNFLVRNLSKDWLVGL